MKTQYIRWMTMLTLVFMLTGCPFNSDDNPKDDTPTAQVLTTQEKAIEKLKAYATSNGSSSVPTLQDYVDAGVTGLDASKLADINEVVENLTAAEVDSTSELQALADALGITIDTTAPVFTSSNTASVNENQTAAITLVATDNSTLTYSISGTDASNLSVDGVTGIVTFNSAPDFETKASYIFTATATDTSSNASTQNITITILDVDELAMNTIKKTGQTKQYDSTTVLNPTVTGQYKDDGFYQKGVDHHYSRDDVNNIVTDHITGLLWQDDTKTTQNINPGATFLTAKFQCDILSLGGFDDWRLPTIEELLYITNRSKYRPAIDTTFFQNSTTTTNHIYWSSTESNKFSGTYFGLSPAAGLSASIAGHTEQNVRCVKGTSPIIDTTDTLQWQTQWKNNTQVRNTWDRAILYCELLDLNNNGSPDGWRLPNFNELYYSATRNQIPQVGIPAVASNVSGEGIIANRYWSSTTTEGIAADALSVNFYDGHAVRDGKSSSNYIRCVKDK